MTVFAQLKRPQIKKSIRYVVKIVHILYYSFNTAYFRSYLHTYAI